MSHMAAMQIGERLFTDGTTRPVYLDGDGRQYVLDCDGRRVYGVWTVTPEVLEEAPLVVYGKPKQEGS